MNEAEAIAGLKNPLPSERARAAQWFLANSTEQHAAVLTRAIETEVVPSIRQLLTTTAVRRKRPTGRDTPSVGGVYNGTERIDEEILDGLSGLIRHETEPVIGWLRRSAAREIGDAFEASETSRNIDLLRRRILGLEALAAAHRVPRWTRSSLSSLVASCRPPEMSADTAVEQMRSDDLIDTDPGLFSIIISNALQNAYEAAAEEEEGAVWFETGVTDRDFWISITNRFHGQSFEFEYVAHTGASSKASHKGLGLSAMALAADRLGYSLALTANGGNAFFSIRGGRFRE